MDQMTKLLNRIRDSRLDGATSPGIQDPDPSPFCRTRVEYVDRILSEAVAVQVENQSAVDPGEQPEPDDELDARVEELRAARDESALAAYVLADQLRAYLTDGAGYCDRDELPTYRPQRHR